MVGIDMAVPVIHVDGMKRNGICLFPAFFNGVMCKLPLKITFIKAVVAVLKENVFGEQCAIKGKDHPGEEEVEASVHNCDTNEKTGKGIAIYQSDPVLLFFIW